MAGLTLAQLRSGIQDWGYTTDTATTQNNFINRVYEKICGAERWPFLEKQDRSLSTSNGVNAYTLPMSDWRNLDAVRIEDAASQNFVNLHYKSPQELRSDEHIDRDVATPYYWSWFNGQLHFYPYPDGVYLVTIDYIMEPPVLAADGDTPVLPVPYHELLILGAVQRMAHRERDWIGENMANTEYTALYKQMEDEYLIRQRQSSSHVKRSGYYDTQIPFPFIHDGF